MRKAERYGNIIGWFRDNKPVAETELVYSSPYSLLVAVMLSAQCTDKRVNMVMPALMEAFPTPDAMAAATPQQIFPFIKSVSYPNSKAQHLAGMARKLVSDFGGIVPDSIEKLMTMPGVGRKTANVVASIIYDKPVIAVDTHVFRVSHRLGLSDGKTVDAVEKDLEAMIPECDRTRAHHWLILHGRYTCTARAPKCSECPLTQWCRNYLKANK